MRQVVILGSPDTKRMIYLKKAAEQEGLPITFVDWKDWESWFEQNKSDSRLETLVLSRHNLPLSSSYYLKDSTPYFQ